ncbi:MAG: DUF1636 domain-containing protein [Pseudomonadota bacterium]
MSDAETTVDLLICVKCRISDAIEQKTTAGAGEPRAGQALFDRLMTRPQPVGIRIRAVECLSNCSRGCSVALRGNGKWSYVYGNLRPEDTDLILEGSAKYNSAAEGLVPWRERPEHFRKNCIARIPPQES